MSSNHESFHKIVHNCIVKFLVTAGKFHGKVFGKFLYGHLINEETIDHIPTVSLWFQHFSSVENFKSKMYRTLMKCDANPHSDLFIEKEHDSYKLYLFDVEVANINIYLSDEYPGTDISINTFYRRYLSVDEFEEEYLEGSGEIEDIKDEIAEKSITILPQFTDYLLSGNQSDNFDKLNSFVNQGWTIGLFSYHDVPIPFTQEWLKDKMKKWDDDDCLLDDMKLTYDPSNDPICDSLKEILSLLQNIQVPKPDPIVQPNSHNDLLNTLNEIKQVLVSFQNVPNTCKPLTSSQEDQNDQILKQITVLLQKAIK